LATKAGTHTRATLPLIALMSHEIAQLEFEGKLKAAVEEPGQTAQEVDFGQWQATAAFGFPQPDGRRAPGTKDAHDNYRPHIRLGDELERQEGATLPFRHNHFRYHCNPLAIARNTESIPVPEFFGPDHSRRKLRKEGCRTIAQFRARQIASNRHVMRPMLHGRLAGGTTLFMCKYSS